MNTTIRTIKGPIELDALRALLSRYAKERHHGFCFKSFETELAELPGSSQWFGAFIGEELCGCAALTPLENNTCEMRRLYVTPEFRGNKLGLELARQCLAQAKANECRTVIIHTVPDMHTAIAMYERFGFIKTGHREGTPVMIMSLSLDA